MINVLCLSINDSGERRLIGHNALKQVKKKWTRKKLVCGEQQYSAKNHLHEWAAPVPVLCGRFRYLMAFVGISSLVVVLHIQDVFRFPAICLYYCCLNFECSAAVSCCQLLQTFGNSPFKGYKERKESSDT